MNFTKTIILLVAALVATPAFAQDNMQILREKIKADKKLVVAVNMGLTESEAKGFWPVYEAYQKELHKINARLGELILDYADAYNQGPVADKTAKKLLKEALNIEDAELRCPSGRSHATSRSRLRFVRS